MPVPLLAIGAAAVGGAVTSMVAVNRTKEDVYGAPVAMPNKGLSISGFQIGLLGVYSLGLYMAYKLLKGIFL